MRCYGVDSLGSEVTTLDPDFPEKGIGGGLTTIRACADISGNGETLPQRVTHYM